MRLSDLIAEFLLSELSESKGSMEIGRNDLAVRFGCVPSQINYVISSRFTPEQGYIVESQRGGGGFIRITRVNNGKNNVIMHFVNSVGESLDRLTARIYLENMMERNILNESEANMIASALSDKCYSDIVPSLRDRLRAKIFKNMLINLI